MKHGRINLDGEGYADPYVRNGQLLSPVILQSGAELVLGCSFTLSANGFNAMGSSTNIVMFESVMAFKSRAA